MRISSCLINRLIHNYGQLSFISVHGMATIARSKSATHSLSTPLIDLDSHIPSPFPRNQLARDTVPTPSAVVEDVFADSQYEAGPSTSALDGSTSEASGTVALKELMPSIVYVQKSCLMTLNNLLSEPIRWNPIVPDRRHSMPSSIQPSTAAAEDSSSTSALQTLVKNLRNHQASGEMVEAREESTDAELLRELSTRIGVIARSLSEADAALAKALVSLLTDLNRLSELQANITHLPAHLVSEETSSILEAPPPIDVFDRLTRQLSDLQIERLSSQAQVLVPGASPLFAVETALLWSRIDADLEKVVAMCKHRTDSFIDNLPPQYDPADYEDDDGDLQPPEYDQMGRPSFDDSKYKAGFFQQQQQGSRQTDEKMKMDLEAVTMAIDRLYLVAPQLHNQRVELKSSKLAEMEKARREVTTKSKGKERDAKELENILNLLGRASERTLKDQSVILDGGMKSRLERSRQKESAKRDAFVEQLVQHSRAGRMHGQDAVLQPSTPRLKDSDRIRDPEAMLTLPEFMREPLPASERQKDSEAMLTLPEFVNEPLPLQFSLLDTDPAQEGPDGKPRKKRSRSLSAPPLAWLRSSSRSSNSSSGSSSSSSKGKAKAIGHAFDVTYVAENHENLHHILVFFTVTGAKAGAELQAEIIPSFLNHPSDGGDHLVIKSGPYSSLPLMLPAHTTPGKKEVRSQGGHHEIKLLTQPSTSPTGSTFSGEHHITASSQLLDATQLLSMNPTSFLCASCSLPLIQSNRVGEYRDLPSEHWEELVEAWMCHSNQKLHEHVQKHGKSGFWPSPGQALVGGSYILFDESTMNRGNLHLAPDSKHDDNWHLTRCLCGAVVGRCQERASEQGKTTVYRVLKYAVRPVSVTSEPFRVPLSAFIVEDMAEFVQAHASYRFVIHDEEEDKPRILIWLFKPRIRLAYTTPGTRGIPKSANILAAKVLYKLLGPTETTTGIKRQYPLSILSLKVT
ncbi:unnamed protein product [Cyclocybe aegerita]|uniref:HECT-like ubiquitin-conjugating enzyme-binding-domain-containing protein n=1 Tax=Cyclocybe aegerita TaxID=1973307 RepID=A0A8S0X4X2_CYCAE|nr:unnamed protein product [Cyclocybe aegerita]